MNTVPRQGSQPIRISDKPRERYICLSCADTVDAWEVTDAGGHRRGLDHCGPMITTTEMLRQYNELHQALEATPCTCRHRLVLRCHDCGSVLQAVPRDLRLNPDQWDAVKAGDYFCTGDCTSNRAPSGKKYWRADQLHVFVVGERCRRCQALDIREPEVIEQ